MKASKVFLIIKFYVLVFGNWSLDQLNPPCVTATYKTYLAYRIVQLIREEWITKYKMKYILIYLLAVADVPKGPTCGR